MIQIAAHCCTQASITGVDDPLSTFQTRAVPRGGLGRTGGTLTWRGFLCSDAEPGQTKCGLMLRPMSAITAERNGCLTASLVEPEIFCESDASRPPT